MKALVVGLAAFVILSVIVMFALAFMSLPENRLLEVASFFALIILIRIAGTHGQTYQRR